MSNLEQEALDNSQLYCLGKRVTFNTKTNFLGVFASDRMPSIHEIDNSCKNHHYCALIVNTDFSDKPGQHWVAYLYLPNHTAEFFDSNGQPPSTYNLPDPFYRSEEHTSELQSH